MTRHPDWPDRLAALLSAVAARHFDARHWNCTGFGLAVTRERPRVRVLPSLEASADSAGFPRIPPLFAGAGDVALACDPDRLGVVVDSGRAAFVGPRGLLREPLTTGPIAWRIG